MAKRKYLALLMTVGMAVSLSACADQAARNSSSSATIAPKRTAVWTRKRPAMHASLSERDCLARAMYFESNRSSADGMLAVGTVVMNRYESGRFGNSICSVVGAPRQFAPGVLSRAMSDGSAPMARGVADEVLSGERYARLDSAMHFHTAGLHFSYPNMHYVAVAGGNAFYEKRDRYFYESAPVVASSAAPVQALAFNGENDGRSGAVIRDLNAAPQRTFDPRPVVTAEAAPVAEPVIRTAPVAAQQPVAFTDKPVPAVLAEKPASAAVLAGKPAVDALLAPTPLPPKRPKLLGLTASPDKRASAETPVRVAANN